MQGSLRHSTRHGGKCASEVSDVAWGGSGVWWGVSFGGSGVWLGVLAVCGGVSCVVGLECGLGSQWCVVGCLEW